MKKIKIIHLVLLIVVFSQSALSQVSSEQKEEKAKNAVDKEAKYLGDTLIVKQSIYYIEEAINNFNTDEILFFLHDRRKKKEEREVFIEKKRKMLSNSFSTLDSVYSFTNKKKIPSKIFRVSNVNLTDQDTIIIANLDMEFAEYLLDEIGNPKIRFKEKDNNDKNLRNIDTNPTKNKNDNLIHDTWVFEKIQGQWKLVSYNELESTLKNYKSNK